MLPIVESPELVFGLCSPIGTDNAKARTLLEHALTKYRYHVEYFKVTKLMQRIQPKDVVLSTTPFEERYNTHIHYANQLRKAYGDPSLLGRLCCGAIRNYRKNKCGQSDGLIDRTAYIFDQFKRREEIDVLRQVYGDLFILVSIHSDKDERNKNIVARIVESHNVSRTNPELNTKAEELIARDENEDGVKHGQRLREAFPLADLFIDINDEDAAEKVINRFLKGFFDSNAVSPTPEEYGMYLAKTASLRSIDLSRQVGAAIIAGRGEIITMGCNEVPKAGGGSYWTEDRPDERDYQRGLDENDRIKRSVLADVVRRLIDGELVTTERTVEQLVENVLEDVARKGSAIREAELMDLLEFGRIIHAEMHALCDAARLGKSVKGATLYSNVFPCHICAKHIVASGINRVVFIEPYPKSYAADLHDDSIVIKRGEIPEDKVQFEAFIGISPLRFRDLFERSKRKDNYGKILAWDEKTAQPVFKQTTRFYLVNETAIMKSLSANTKRLVSDGLVSITTEQAPVELYEPHEAGAVAVE
ncbi:anti-phage dCTP deaminase [Methylorubrum extorquens]|uniref:anti-phage dCTP deaminase n=1 Tax=Methylorubrum extorquens TaxID=408 RepID=UPI001EE56922|nr:anti-phage dCTP deaminase [Methylorubrum extorquens]MCG5246966.1 deaminase [Methylorubrum extorquens]